VTVTSLPHHRPAETVELAVDLAGAGYRAVPHLAARSVESRSQLAGFLDRLGTAGIGEVFVIGGDGGPAAGPYGWSRALMEDIADLGGGAIRMGIAVYPEGLPGTRDEDLLDLLLAKAPLASWAVSQLCFSPEVLLAYAASLRSGGFTLPLHAGVPGPVGTARLLRLAARLGVGPSLNFLRRSAGGAGSGRLLYQLAVAATYDPRPLVRALEEGGEALAGLQVYSFNDLEGLAGLDLLKRP
jgi:methylenetetrahydrofolate reductase (NADPH)